MLKAIFFDNDGVLVSTEHLYLKANQKILAELGHDFCFKEYQTQVLNKGLGIESFLTQRGYEGDSIQKHRRLRDKYYFELIRQQPNSIEGVKEVLEILSRDLSLWVVTASRRDHFDLIHQDTNFLSHFQKYFCREDYIKSKPHPDGYLLALKESGLSPQEALVVEDSPRGIAAAKASGIKSVAIPHGLTMGMDFSHADHLLQDISELPQLIAKINRAT